MELVIIAIGLFIFAMGIYDFKFRRIPDLFAVMFWILFSIIGFSYPQFFPHVVYGFATCYFINILFKYIFNVQFLSWMDILIIPIVWAILIGMKGWIFAGIVLFFALYLSFMWVVIRRMIEKPYGLYIVKAINIEETDEPIIGWLAIAYCLAIFI